MKVPFTFVFSGLALLIASTAIAQTPSASPATTADVTVERIKPEDLPEQEESKFPSVLKETSALPTAASLSDLRSAAEIVGPRVWEVTIVQVPKPPIRSTPLLSSGHAVWISAENGAVRPVLVTPHSWLVDADSIWVRPYAPSKGHMPRAARRSIADISDSRAARRFEKRAEREGWTRVQPGSVDKHRNLALLVAAQGATLKPPATGLPLFDPKSRPTTRVYGYSPAVSSGLVETRYLEPGDDLVLSYYLQCAFGAVLGAPIVTERGEIVGLTVFRHPEEPDRTLVIPPIALTRYVEQAQGLSDDAGPTRKELDEEDK